MLQNPIAASTWSVHQLLQPIFARAELCHGAWSMRFAHIAILALTLATPAQAVEKIDLALVLAVDCSGSVSAREYSIQMSGIAAAFRDPEIVAAALSGPTQKIAVNILTWGDPDEQKFDTGWIIISSPSSAENFAQIAAGVERRVGGGTGLGNALSYGLTLLLDPQISATRQVIDISGDGAESWELREPRFKLVDAQRLRKAAGVTVNGLAIETDDPNLAAYYRKFVAAGPESFVVQVANYEDYAEGIRRKLLQELSPQSASLLRYWATY